MEKAVGLLGCGVILLAWFGFNLPALHHHHENNSLGGLILQYES